MPFFKDLKRRSKASFLHDTASNESNGSNGTYGSKGTAATTKSTSSVNSLNGLSATPTSLHQSTSNLTLSKNSVAGDAPPVPQRPSTLTTQNKRFSTAVKKWELPYEENVADTKTQSSFTGSMTTAPNVPASFYAPRVLSIGENAWVGQAASPQTSVRCSSVSRYIRVFSSSMARLAKAKSPSTAPSLSPTTTRPFPPPIGPYARPTSKPSFTSRPVQTTYVSTLPPPNWSAVIRRCLIIFPESGLTIFPLRALRLCNW